MGTKLIFINVKEPRDALQLTKEPEIRSHVTRYQWRHAETRRKFEKKYELEESPNSTVVTVQASMPHEAIRFEDQLTPMLIPIPPQIGGLRIDPFQSYPISCREFTPHLVDHYLTNLAVDVPELDQPGNNGLLRSSWFPLVMTDPALFLVITLLSASHLASMQTRPEKMRLNLLQMRCETVQAINYALAASELEISDALVGAIAKMASYEAMFGSLKDYHVHMQGLKKAIDLRGGLPSLGLNGLLRRIVVWIDRNSAFLHRSRLYFPNVGFVPGEPLPDPNPGQFLGTS